jgi:hypothetical protein
LDPPKAVDRFVRVVLKLLCLVVHALGGFVYDDQRNPYAIFEKSKK